LPIDERLCASCSYQGASDSVYETDDEVITTTVVYNCEREGTMSFERIPVDGSEKMDDTFMESIEPFDYKEMVPFSTAYLFCCHGVAIAHNLRTAAGAGKRLHLLCFVSFPFTAGSRGIPLCLLGSLRFGSSDFLGGIHFFYSLNFQFGTAVFAGHLIMTGQKRQRRAAVRALIAYRGFSHNITSLKYSYAILIAPAPPLVAYFDILPSTHERWLYIAIKYHSSQKQFSRA